jgi:hypothetical protein
VTDWHSRDKRPPLGDLHDRALAESSEAAAEGAERFMRWFDHEVSTPREEPVSPGGAVGAEAPFEDSDPWWPGRSALGETPPSPASIRRPASIRLALAAAVAAIALAAGYALFGVPRAHSPELARPVAPSHSLPSAAASERASDPCRDATRAAGESPLVDDFEDKNELVALLEGRNGYWVLITDTDPESSESVLLPSLRPAAVPTNRYALHLSGERRTRWGASAQVDLGPSCYDASAYRGIAFDVRGPGRLLAGVRAVDAVPSDRGGTCTLDCYESHLSPVEATDAWTHHELAFSDLHQRGKTEPADPHRLSSLEFLVRPEDTPYDLWIDNVSFLR